MDATDFSDSYVAWTAPHDPGDTRKPGHKPWGNSARILLDARCVLTDQRTDQSEEFVLIVPCRAEWMYQE